MRRFLARFSEPVCSGHPPPWADFLTATPVLKFSVHTMYLSRDRSAEASRLFLLLLSRSKCWLPPCRSTLLTCRRGDCLDLFLLRFLRLSIALLLTFCHFVLLGWHPT